MSYLHCPPDDVATAVPAHHAAVTSDGEVDLAPAFLEVLGDLAAGRGRPYHQDRPGRKLTGVAVTTRVDLKRPMRHGRGEPRDRRALIWTGGDNRSVMDPDLNGRGLRLFSPGS